MSYPAWDIGMYKIMECRVRALDPIFVGNLLNKLSGKQVRQ